MWLSARLCKQQTNIEVFYVMRCSFPKTFSLDFQSLLEVVWKNTVSMETALRQRFGTKSDEESAF